MVGPDPGLSKLEALFDSKVLAYEIVTELSASPKLGEIRWGEISFSKLQNVSIISLVLSYCGHHFVFRSYLRFIFVIPLEE